MLNFVFYWSRIEIFIIFAAETSSCKYSPTADWQVGVSSILHLFAILSVFLQACGEVISNAYKSPSEANYGTKTG
jgi:hypothetical protein